MLERWSGDARPSPRVVASPLRDPPGGRVESMGGGLNGARGGLLLAGLLLAGLLLAGLLLASLLLASLLLGGLLLGGLLSVEGAFVS